MKNSIIEAILKHKAARLNPKQKSLRLLKAPKIRPPIELERQYYKEIYKITTENLYKIVQQQLMPMLLNILENAKDDLVRKDNYGSLIDTIFNSMRVAYARQATNEEVDQTVQKYAALGEALNKRQLNNITQKVLGLSPIVAEPYLKPIMKEFTATNTNLIRSISNEFFDKLQADTYRHVQAGVYNKVYAGKIEAKYADEYRKQFEKGFLKKRVFNTEARSRLIARDQISKYNGQLNQVRQTNLGITKYRWQTANDERVRDRHKQLNGRIFDWNDPPLSDSGEPINPGDDYQCFTGDMSINLFDDTVKVFRRWYTGILAKIVTESGETIYATPNHPFLTNGRWIAVKDLKPGDNLIKITNENFISTKFNINKTKTTIDNVFHSFSKFGSITSTRGVFANFHGDGTEANIDIVRANSALGFCQNTYFIKSINNFFLTISNATKFFNRSFTEFFFRTYFTSNFIMSMFSKCKTLINCHSAHSNNVCFGAISNNNSIFTKYPSNRHTTNSDYFANSKFADTLRVLFNNKLFIKIKRRAVAIKSIFSSINSAHSQFNTEIIRVNTDNLSSFLESKTGSHKLCCIREITFSKFSGHVFNLETKKGWYCVDNIITSNCRCIAIPIFDSGVTDDPALQKLLNS